MLCLNYDVSVNIIWWQLLQKCRQKKRRIELGVFQRKTQRINWINRNNVQMQFWSFLNATARHRTSDRKKKYTYICELLRNCTSSASEVKSETYNDDNDDDDKPFFFQHLLLNSTLGYKVSIQKWFRVSSNGYFHIKNEPHGSQKKNEHHKIWSQNFVKKIWKHP